MFIFILFDNETKIPSLGGREGKRGGGEAKGVDIL